MCLKGLKPLFNPNDPNFLRFNAGVEFVDGKGHRAVVKLAQNDVEEVWAQAYGEEATANATANATLKDLRKTLVPHLKKHGDFQSFNTDHTWTRIA